MVVTKPRIKYQLLARLIITFFIFSLPAAGTAMSIFDAGKACIASAIKVQVIKNGEPVRNAHVIREVDWHNVGKESDSATTDSEGVFELPALYMRSITRSLLPLEFVATTQIKLDVGGEIYEILYAAKRTEAPNDEFGGKQGVFKCDLNQVEEELHRFGASILDTRCTFNL